MSDFALKLAGTEPDQAAESGSAVRQDSSRPQVYIDLATAAERSGKNRADLSRRCGNEWHPRGLAKLVQQPGKKSQWFVREDADPGFAAVKFPEQLKLDLSSLDASHREQVIQRKRILDNWLEARAGGVKLGMNEGEVTAKFLMRVEAEERLTINRATLYRWHSCYRESGLPGLQDRRREKESSAGFDDPFLDECKRWWLDQRQRSARLCFGIAEAKAIEQGWKLTGYRRVCQLLAAIPRTATVKAREGPEAHNNKVASYIKRDYSTLHSNEQWVGDHHRFDVMVQCGTDKKGKPKYDRPWLTAWMDMRSRKIMGWCIFAHDPNQNSILSALRAGIIDNGVPELLYVDNGKDFDSYAFHGRTKKERFAERAARRAAAKKGEAIIDEKPVAGILGHLGIKARFCWAFHGQSKPIERFFNTLEDRFGKLWETYCGNSPENRPEDYQKKLDGGQAPQLADFIQAFSEWVENDYHARGHEGNNMDGRSPVAVYAGSWGEASKRTTTQEMLNLLLMKQTKPVPVKRGGSITCNKLDYGMGNPALIPWIGKKVYLRVDERQIKSVLVFSLDDRFICIAQADGSVPANATDQHKRTALDERKRIKKDMAAYNISRPRAVESMADTVARVVYAEAAANTHSVDNPPPISPVRSPLEGELDALREAQERGKYRIAVGAESMSDPLRSGQFILNAEAHTVCGAEDTTDVSISDLMKFTGGES